MQQVKIYTRSINYELYRRSQRLIGLGLPRVRLVNTTADGYFYRMLADRDCQWAINIDEDAFVTDGEAILALLRHMQREGIVACGMSDGMLVRPGNPVVLNPFFNVLNLEAIRARFSAAEVRDFCYEARRDSLVAQLPEQLREGRDMQLGLTAEEPFYKFFFWLADCFPPLYLDARTHPDGISTVLFNHEGRRMLLHSWFSRCWRTDEAHTARIEALYREALQASGQQEADPWWWRHASGPDRAWQVACRKARTAMRLMHLKNGEYNG